jgi:hypothetical protein
MKKLRFIHVASFFGLFGLLIAYIALGLVSFWLFYPYRTMEIHNFSAANPNTIIVSAPSFKLGQPISYVLDYCKYTDVSPVVSRVLVDGQQISLTNPYGYLATGCHKDLVQTAIIPDTINPGTYYLDMTLRYTVNPIRTITIHYVTNSFQVTR